jgi:outer membrane immunogenic protein
LGNSGPATNSCKLLLFCTIPASADNDTPIALGPPFVIESDSGWRSTKTVQKGSPMRKYLALITFLAASPIAAASAADMPLKAPRAPYAAAYSWTGLYIGGEIGGGWSRQTITQVDPSGGFPAGFVNSPTNLNGFLGGGYAGYNYQMNNIVIGIDGYYDGADLTGSGSDISPTTGNVSNKNDRMKWDSAITGRLGLANNNWLFFVKGGWAWAGFNSTGVTTTAGGVAVGTGTSSDTRDGGTVGVGIEYGFTPHWSAKVEYDYVKFETSSFNAATVSAAGVVGAPARSVTSDLNEVKGGVAYRF